MDILRNLSGVAFEASCFFLFFNFFFNLSIDLSAATLYVQFTGGNQIAIPSTPSICNLIVILIYYAYNRITNTVYWRRMRTTFLQVFEDP